MAKTKRDMVKYLVEHYRYDTCNSWNNSTSYAANVKLREFVPRNLMDKAFEILEQGDVFDSINEAITEFAREHDYKWQVGFNGRSGGYLVLYRGGKREDGGVYSQPGLHTDQGEDFSEWSKADVLDRYKLVRKFDELVDDCKKIFLEFCEGFEVVEKTVMVPRKFKVLKEIGA